MSNLTAMARGILAHLAALPPGESATARQLGGELGRTSSGITSKLNTLVSAGFVVVVENGGKRGRERRYRINTFLALQGALASKPWTKEGIGYEVNS